MTNWNEIRHFAPREFNRNDIDFAPVMSEKFILGLDELREQSGHRIMISPNKHALGRRNTKYKSSQHYFGLEVTELSVADIIPYSRIDGEKCSLSRVEARSFVELAADIGFTGIGVYPMWHPASGFHIDMRELPAGRQLASWAALMEDVPYEGNIIRKQVYYGIETGLSVWSEIKKGF